MTLTLNKLEMLSVWQGLYDLEAHGQELEKEQIAVMDKIEKLFGNQEGMLIQKRKKK